MQNPVTAKGHIGGDPIAGHQRPKPKINTTLLIVIFSGIGILIVIPFGISRIKNKKTRRSVALGFVVLILSIIVAFAVVVADSSMINQ